MPSAINEALLDQKLTELEKARAWSPRVVSKLEALLRAEQDAELFKVNPMKFAADRGVAPGEAVDLFLHACKLGVFRMNWDIMCPSCSDTVSSFSTLRTLNAHFHCHLCNLDSMAHLDDYIRVSFTPSPEVRDIKFNHPETLTPFEFFTPYRFSPGGRIPGGPYWLEVAAKMTKHVSFLEPGSRSTVELEVEPGFLKGYDLINNTGFMFEVKGERRASPQAVRVQFLDGQFVLSEEHLWPGKAVFTVENPGERRASLAVMFMPPDYFQQRTGPLVFDPFLSGKALFTNQTFRDLFQLETVKGAEGIGVREITLLFTDLKGSTAMYDRIGDLKAFALVQQHFHRLSRVVRSHDGAIVKTIGDAIMASFATPEGAVKAALEMLAEIEAFNQEHGAREIILKIGVHKGASIAVTLNDRLDFFGQTVNIAARVQGLADAEEIYVTDEVMQAPGVKGLVQAPFHAEAKTAHLKGIEQAMHVHRIAEHGAVPANGAAKGDGTVHAHAKPRRAPAPKAHAARPKGRKPAKAGRR